MLDSCKEDRDRDRPAGSGAKSDVPGVGRTGDCPNCLIVNSLKSRRVLEFILRV